VSVTRSLCLSCSQGHKVPKAMGARSGPGAAEFLPRTVFVLGTLEAEP
jgi:hypothetical protein